jgi:hypothetical protein
MGVLMGSVKKKQKAEKYEVYADQVMAQFAKEMAKEYGLVVSGTGGSMPFGVTSLEMMFYCYQRATIEEARELEVVVTEKFVEKINQHQKLRKYLREYPFPVSKAEISIVFCKPDNSRYDDGSVSRVVHFVDKFKQDKIFYDKENPKTDRSEDLYEEPYSDAFAIVQKKFQAMSPPKVLRPIPEKDDNYEIYVNQLFYEFDHEVLDERSVVFLLCGQGVKMNHAIEEFFVDFNLHNKVDLAEARRLELFLIDRFIKRINQKENLQKYLCERPFPVNRTKVVLSFCHEDNTLFTEGVSEVRYENGELTYYLENPKTGKLQEIHREPYKN